MDIKQKSARVSVTIEDGKRVKDTWSRKMGLVLMVFEVMDSLCGEEFITCSLFQGTVLSFQPHWARDLNTFQKKVLEWNLQEGEMVNGTIKTRKNIYEGDVWSNVPHGHWEAPPRRKFV